MLHKNDLHAILRTSARPKYASGKNSFTFLWTSALKFGRVCETKSVPPSLMATLAHQSAVPKPSATIRKPNRAFELAIKSHRMRNPKNQIHQTEQTHMTTKNRISTTVRAAALVGAFSLIAVSTSQAIFMGLPSPTPEAAGVLLGGLTATGGGTIVATKSEAFTNAFNAGTLNTWVVDRGAGLLDFYYQVVNASAVPPPALDDAQVWRVKTNGGFLPIGSVGAVSVAQTDISPVTGLPVAGLKPARTADRDEGSLGSVGFEFPVAPYLLPPGGDPLNVAVGQSSAFLVVRTNSTSFAMIAATISSADNSVVSTFAAVPEPGSVLFGLAMFGVTLSSRIRARRAKTA